MSFGIGNRIKGLREELEVSRADFGDKLKITADQVRKIETEDRKPSEEVYIGLNREFGFSLDFIFTGKAWKNSSEYINLTMNTDTGKKAIDDLNKVAKAVKSLDADAYMGIEYLEKEKEQYDKDPATENALGMVKTELMERMVAN